MRISHTLTATIILLCLCLPARNSWGWIDTGHKVIALIAWDDLTPKTKTAISTILKNHPRYEKDLAADAPEAGSDDDLARHVFIVAATWPDLVRSQDHPMHVEYNHPAWHYIDIPYVVGPPTTQPATRISASEGSGPHNIVEALTQCSAELKDPATIEGMRAVDLCWIEHLVGDIHQPLHAISLYSAQFPRGDAGGNSEILLKRPPYPDSRANLHLIWDSLAGDFRSETLDGYEAEGLRADPKFSREHLKNSLADTDFASWARESHALAVQDVYLNGTLQAAAASGHGRVAGDDPIPGIPAGYLANAEKVAMQQIALAGYRLADLLNSIYDPASQPAK